MIDLDSFNRLTQAGVPPATALDVLSGTISEAEALEWARRNQAAEIILRKAVKDRPRPPLVWDVSPAEWHRSLDGCDPGQFAAAYPDAVVCSVCLEDLIGALAERAQRRSGPWSSQYRSKTARLVAHLEAGGRVTPPFVAVVPNGLALAGGYHRLGWAQFLGETMLPVLLSGKALPTISRLASSLVDDGGVAALGS